MRSRLTLSALLLTFAAIAQQPLRVPLAATFGPVRMTQGQTLHVCVNNLFSNALTTNQVSTAPLQVRLAFVDAINGALIDKTADMSLTILKGACLDLPAPDTQPESHIIAIVVPISQQDPKQASTDILPICSTTLLEGSGPQARTISMVQMVPKVNILVPRPRQ
jgi:hypothetical protein